jgi:hypothetical protein
MNYSVEGLTNTADGEGTVRHVGDYESLEAAINAAKSVVDDFLITTKRNGMTVAQLFSEYKSCGEVPFIFCDGDKTMNVREFSHINYAIHRCAEICEGDAN